MDACADWVARAAAAVDDVAVAGVAVFVLIAFLALFWSDEDPDEERP